MCVASGSLVVPSCNLTSSDKYAEYRFSQVFCLSGNKSR